MNAYLFLFVIFTFSCKYINYTIVSLISFSSTAFKAYSYRIILPPPTHESIETTFANHTETSPYQQPIINATSGIIFNTQGPQSNGTTISIVAKSNHTVSDRSRPHLGIIQIYLKYMHICKNIFIRRSQGTLCFTTHSPKTSGSTENHVHRCCAR